MQEILMFFFLTTKMIGNLHTLAGKKKKKKAGRFKQICINCASHMANISLTTEELKEGIQIAKLSNTLH